MYMEHSTTRTHFQLTSIPETVTKVDWVCGSRVKDTKTLKTFELSKVLKSLFECPNVFTSMVNIICLSCDQGYQGYQAALHHVKIYHLSSPLRDHCYQKGPG